MKNEILKTVGKVVISAAVGYVTTKVMEKAFDKVIEISGKRFDKKWKKKDGLLSKLKTFTKSQWRKHSLSSFLFQKHAEITRPLMKGGEWL